MGLVYCSIGLKRAVNLIEDLLCWRVYLMKLRVTIEFVVISTAYLDYGSLPSTVTSMTCSEASDYLSV